MLRRCPAASLAALTLAALTLTGGDARAQDHPPVTDRDFTLDLYTGTAVGSLRTVGMGGAAVAIAEGSAGAIANPASPAVRAETSRGRWDWDWHFDYLSTGLGADADNNGIAEETEFGLLEGPVVTLGGVYQFTLAGRWGVGLSATQSRHPTAGAAPDTTVTPIASVGRLSLAREVLGGDLMLGAGVKVGTLAVEERIEDEAASQLFSITGAALEVGALWRPGGRDLRLGATASLPVTGDEVVTDDCDPLDCEGFIVPGRIAVPWQVAVGAAWRRGATRWNRAVAERWRDERSWLYALDVVVTGRTPDGHGVEAYSRGQLQPSGRRTAVSVRGGVEREARAGRVRLRAGSYWEPSRFEDEVGAAVPARLHLTLGLDVRIATFCFARQRHRLRLSLTADGAERYGNGGLSIGLWH